MGSNQYGYWKDADMKAAQRRLDIAKRRICDKYTKKHNDLVAKLEALRQQERDELKAAKQRWEDETDAAVTLWPEDKEIK
ncbi:hypothetical protein NKJ23_15960 [Mesorhizobium sp. M0184]|uniref:hypothetical protein n=1 Tax=Mesorhizobium sp. M0184 TaxID=2956906 RepID=UPI00333A7494